MSIRDLAAQAADIEERQTWHEAELRCRRWFTDHLGAAPDEMLRRASPRSFFVRLDDVWLLWRDEINVRGVAKPGCYLALHDPVEKKGVVAIDNRNAIFSLADLGRVLACREKEGS